MALHTGAEGRPGDAVVLCVLVLPGLRSPQHLHQLYSLKDSVQYFKPV